MIEQLYENTENNGKISFCKKFLVMGTLTFLLQPSEAVRSFDCRGNWRRLLSDVDSDVVRIYKLSSSLALQRNI